MLAFTMAPLLLASGAPREPVSADRFSAEFEAADLSAWTGEPADDWRVDDGVLHSPVSGGVAGMLRARFTARDVSVRVDVKLPAEGRRNPGVVFRFREKGTGWVVRWYDREQWLELLRYEDGQVVRVGGNHWQASSPGGSAPQQPGEWHTMVVQAVGEQVRAKVWPRGGQEPDWQLDAECPDLAEGMVGVSVDETAAQFDNFVALTGAEIADLIGEQQRLSEMQRQRRRSIVLSLEAGGGELPHFRLGFTTAPGAENPAVEGVLRARDTDSYYFSRAVRGKIVLGKVLAGQETELAEAPVRWWRGPGRYTMEVAVTVAECDERGPAWFVNADHVPPMVRLSARLWSEEAKRPRGWQVSATDDPIIPGRRGEPYWHLDPFATSSARNLLGTAVGRREEPGVTWTGLEIVPRRAPTDRCPTVDPCLRIATGDRGGCWLALGDVDGDGRLDYVVARNDDQAVMALTAYGSDGRELWRWGEGGRANISYDVPATVWDIDEDGCAEVLCSVRGFLLTLDGRTGREKARWPLPKGLEVADCMVIANLRGQPQPADIIIKSRYDHLWAFTNDWELLWGWKGNTGHCPAVRDIDGDGRDEVLCGYALIDHDGRVLWQADLPDHADTTRLVSMEPGGPVRALLGCGGGNDMALLSLDGTIIWREHPAIANFHFQSAHVGDLRPDLPGYEVMVDDGWARPGRAQLALFDARGRWLGAYYVNYPRFARLVDWRGDGTASIVLPADQAVCDGRGRCLARLAEAPVLGGPGAESPMVQTADVCGDGRDELVFYNADEIVVYRNPRPAPKGATPRATVQERRRNFTYY